MATTVEPGTELMAEAPDAAAGGAVVPAGQGAAKPNMLPAAAAMSFPNAAEVLSQPAVRKAMPAIITLDNHRGVLDCLFARQRATVSLLVSRFV